VKLREVDLDASGRDPTERFTFRDHTRCISALYARVLSPVVTRSGWKILVECVDAKTRDDVQDLLGVLVYEIEHDVAPFFRMSGAEKKRETLEILHRGVLQVAARCGLPAGPFETAYEEVIRRDYRNAFAWRKPVYHPSRRKRAVVRCEHEVEYFRATLAIEARDGAELAATTAFTERPSEFLFVPLLGRLSWRGDTAVLKDDDGAIVSELVAPAGA
jgi:hypothetical protein